MNYFIKQIMADGTEYGLCRVEAPDERVALFIAADRHNARLSTLKAEKESESLTVGPSFCPYCGSMDLRSFDAVNVIPTEPGTDPWEMVEYQCHGPCEGRSFVA